MTQRRGSDSTRLAGAGSGWTNSGNIVSSNNTDATTTVTGTRHGTLVNGATYTTGQSGQAVNLDGSNDYVSLPEGSVAGLTDFSIVDVGAARHDGRLAPAVRLRHGDETTTCI